MSVAREVAAQIVCIDSATVYRGMDIGTAKPTRQDCDEIPHHLLDLLDPAESLTVAQFQVQGRRAVDQVWEQGQTPLLVGGAGLYFRAVVDPLEFPGTDSVVRKRLESELEVAGPAAMHGRLTQVDAQAAARIDPANGRRTVRALEVLEVTGRPFSSFRTGWEPRISIYDLQVAGLRTPVEQMDEQIDSRVDRLIKQGWVEEVKALPKLSATSAQVLGYAQILSYLDGSSTLDDAIAEIKRRTRKFARRQLRWFKADPRIVWFEDAALAKEYLIEH